MSDVAYRRAWPAAAPPQHLPAVAEAPRAASELRDNLEVRVRVSGGVVTCELLVSPPPRRRTAGR